MRVEGEENKILFCGRREGRRKKGGGGRKNIIIFVSLSTLMYFSPWVISSICKYWFRIRHCWAGCRQPRALLGVQRFQGCQSTKKIQGLALQWELCLPKPETEHLLPLQGPAWAGVAQRVQPGMCHCWRALWVICLGVSCTKGSEDNQRAKWSNIGRKGH